MSYIRAGWPLTYFEGESKEYVFSSVMPNYPKDKRVYVEDYDSKYGDNASLAELIVEFIERATGDKKYAWKMAGILAKKLKVKRRKNLLSDKELDSEMDRLVKADKYVSKVMKQLHDDKKSQDKSNSNR